MAQVRLERLPQADLGNGFFRNPVMVVAGADSAVVHVGTVFFVMAGDGWLE